MMNVMIDIETLGTKPGSVITSVGAVAFDDDNLGRELEVSLDIQNALDFGFTVDASTLRFWNQQDQQLFAQQLAEAPVPSLGLNKLTTFFDDVRGDPNTKLRVWANAPTFDLAMLREYYSRYNIKVPWHYTEEFDQRTFAFLMGMERHRGSGDFKVNSAERAHSAVDDARSQARATIHMLTRLDQLQDLIGRT